MFSHITDFLLALKGLQGWKFLAVWVLALLAILSAFGYLPFLGHLLGVQLPVR